MLLQWSSSLEPYQSHLGSSTSIQDQEHQSFGGSDQAPLFHECSPGDSGVQKGVKSMAPIPPWSLSAPDLHIWHFTLFAK